MTARDERAIDMMRAFACGPCYAATSWGKDSTVIAHLLYRSGLNVPLVNIAQHGPQYDDDCPRVRDAFATAFDVNYCEISVKVDNRDQHDSDKAAGLIEGIRIANRTFATERYIGGVRAAESGVRKLGMRARGLATENTCQPIGWWSDADVFGYLAYHCLPVHPAYAMTGGGRWERRHIRVSIIGGAKGQQFGRREWEQEYYGDVLRRLQ